MADNGTAGNGSVDGAGAASGAPEQQSAAWQAVQLTLWLIAGMLGLPETAYRGLGIDARELEALRVKYAAEIEALRMMQLAARLMDRNMTAELLRCRVNCMALAARTPSELAAVARTVKTLPDWVWDDVVVSEAGPGSQGRVAGEHGVGMGNAGGMRSGSLMDEQADAASGSRPYAGYTGAEAGALLTSYGYGPRPEDGMNRQQRRALEAKLRKGR